MLSLKHGFLGLLLESHLFINLTPYKTSKDVWGYLQTVYHQDNSVSQLQLECDIAEYTQGNLSIQEYYSRFRNLWSKYDGIKYANKSDDDLKAIQDL